jgi:hypothetical protein
MNLIIYLKNQAMKKIIFSTMAVMAFFSVLFISCEKDESEKHEYTQEELDEIARQDSLKNIIPASYVFAQDVTIPLTDDYSGVTVCLTPDTSKLLELFEYNTVAELVAGLGTLDGGVQSDNDITFYAYNYSTKYEYTSPSTTNYFGHWFDMNGDVCNWGDQAYLYCEKVIGDVTTLDFVIACYPSRPAEGSTYTIVEAMKYDTTKVAFMFNITIGEAPEEPELVYPVTTIVGSETYDIEAEKNNDYVPTPVSIDAAAITAAIGIAPGDADIYGVDASDDSLYIYGSTAEEPGYWFHESGDVCHWGDEGCAIYANYIIADELFNVGQYPDGTTPGETYSVKIAFVNPDNLTEYDVIINVTITGAAAVYPETTLETTLNLSLSVDAAGADVWVDNLLALDTAAIETAIGCGPADADLYGVNETTDSLYIDGFTAVNGCWFNASGDVCSWGAEGISMYVEYRPETQEIGFGQMPAACVSGTTYYGRLAFVNGDKRAEVQVAMTIK